MTSNQIYQLTEEDLKSEQWVDVKGYENLYRISSMGRLRNTLGVTQGTLNRCGHLRCSLHKNGIHAYYLVHTLVATHFVENKDNKPYVLHLGHQTDNRHHQLTWSTGKERGAFTVNNKRKHYTRRVRQIDINTGGLIKLYDKRRDITNDGFNLKCVQNCAMGQSKSYKGFSWKYEDDDIENPTPTKKRQTYNANESWANLEHSNDEIVNKYVNYTVSDHGRVKVIKTGHIICIGPFQSVSLWSNGKVKMFLIGRLVLLAFNVPNPEGKSQADHINSDHTDHRLSNLRWATAKENSNNENSKIKRSALIQKNMMSLKVVNVDTNEETVYHGVTRAATALSMNHRTIKQYIKNGQVYKGYRFYKIEPVQ
jgi:hypothetical protein